MLCRSHQFQQMLNNFASFEFCILKKLKKKILAKSQLTSKANCQAVNSYKNQTNEFVFTNMGRVFVHVLEEIEDTQKDISKLSEL